MAVKKSKKKSKTIPSSSTTKINIILHLPITDLSAEEQSLTTYSNFFDKDLKEVSNTLPMPYEDDASYEMLQCNQDLNNPDHVEETIDNSPKMSNTLNLQWGSENKIHCFWDCHPFDNEPCGIPYDFFEGLSLQPCFCSYECALAYLLQTQTYCTWEKVALLKSLYRKQILKTNPDILEIEELKPAPNRDILTIFGGTVDIETFRKKNHKMTYIILQKPLAPFKRTLEIIQKIEDNPSEQQSYSATSSPRDNLVLRRKKPIFNPKNSLEMTMGLRPIN